MLLPYPISYDRKAAGRYVLADCVFATASKEQTMIGEGGGIVCVSGVFLAEKKSNKLNAFRYQTVATN